MLQHIPLHTPTSSVISLSWAILTNRLFSSPIFGFAFSLEPTTSCLLSPLSNNKQNRTQPYTYLLRCIIRITCTYSSWFLLFYSFSNLLRPDFCSILSTKSVVCSAFHCLSVLNKFYPIDHQFLVQSIIFFSLVYFLCIAPSTPNAVWLLYFIIGKFLPLILVKSFYSYLLLLE